MNMNIICNNCVGARLYEVQHKQFVNPFTWCIIPIDDFMNLILHFDEIDFINDSNFSLEKYRRNDYQTVKVTLPFNIELHYIHYIQDETYLIPAKDDTNTNIRYDNILTYAKEIWNKRVLRMKEEPIFMYSFNYTIPNSEQYDNELNKILNINTNKKILVLTHESLNISSNKENIKIIRLEDNVFGREAIKLANKLSEYIQL